MVFGADYYHPERIKAINTIQNNPHIIAKKLCEVVEFKRELVNSCDSDLKYLGLAGVESHTGELSGIDEEASGQAFYYKSGDILYGRLRPYLNKVLLAECNGICSTEFHIIRILDTTEILPEYLAVILRSEVILAQTKHMMTGNTHPRISNDDVKNLLIPIPQIKTQIDFVNKFYNVVCNKRNKLKQADYLISTAKKRTFETLGLGFDEYIPSLYSHSTLGTLKEMGVYCNPHSNYLNTVFAKLRANKYYAGNLEDVVEVNPTTSRKELQDDSMVSFVPMPAVTEKVNEVIYEQKEYAEVKTGFTIFQKGDLLWAKITPCMQNGKSFIADAMPTEIGFGSTEFHILRKKSERIYMPFLWVLLADEHILEAAQGMFGGSAGQQRVPDTFLKKFPIVLPPIEIQKELADNVFAALSKSKQLREQADREWQEAKTQFEKELFIEIK